MAAGAGAWRVPAEARDGPDGREPMDRDARVVLSAGWHELATGWHRVQEDAPCLGSIWGQTLHTIP